MASYPSIWETSGINNPGDILTPGTKTFSTTVKSSSTLRWMFFWCTSNANLLAENLNSMTVNLLIDGLELKSNQIYQYEENTGGWACHYWSTTLSDWVINRVTQLEIHYRFSQSTNDGYLVYPAGDYYIKFDVTVQ